MPAPCKHRSFLFGEENVEEARKFKRVDGEIDVSYRPLQPETAGETAGERNGAAVNIASGGVFVKTGAPMAVGTELELQFSVPVRYNALQAKGTVVWVDEISDNPGMGVEFSSIDSIAKYDLVRSTGPGAWIHSFGILQ